MAILHVFLEKEFYMKEKIAHERAVRPNCILLSTYSFNSKVVAGQSAYSKRILDNGFHVGLFDEVQSETYLSVDASIKVALQICSCNRR